MHEWMWWALMIVTNFAWWLQCRAWERTCKRINSDWFAFGKKLIDDGTDRGAR